MKNAKRIIALFVLLALVFSSLLSLNGCNSKNEGNKPPADTTENKGSQSTTDSFTNRIPSENEEKIRKAVDLYLYNSGSPLAGIIAILGDSQGYTADLTVTDNAVDYKDTVTKYSVSARGDEGRRISISSSYDNCEPVELEIYTTDEEIAFSSKELYGDQTYGFTYDDLYNKLSSTPFSPTEDYSTSINISALKASVHKALAEIGKFDIGSQKTVLKEVKDAFYYSAEEVKAIGSLSVNDTGVTGDVYSFTVTGKAYESFYSSLEEILSDNTTVRNYLVNSATDFLGFDTSLLDLDAEGYKDFIGSLSDKGKEGAENGAEISVKVCIKDDELSGVVFTNKSSDKERVYSFVKNKDESIVYRLYSFDKYDPSVDTPVNLGKEQSGIITVENSDKEHKVQFTYKLSLTRTGLNEPYVYEDNGSFEWNKESGAYRLVYIDLLTKHTREGKLTYDHENGSFELESYCRLPKVESMADENYFEYYSDTLLNGFGDMKLSFRSNKNQHVCPEYTDILKMSPDKAREFTNTTLSNFAKAMNNESFANFFASTNREFMRIRCPEDINDLRNINDRLKLGVCFMYFEVYNCFDTYYYAEREEVIEKAFNDLGMIENGKYFWEPYSMFMPYDEAMKDPNYRGVSHYVITVENYKATVTYED